MGLVLEASFPYSDPGAVCTDNIDGDNLKAQTSTASSVNVEKTGTYLITYRAQDQSGNWNDADSCTDGPSVVRTVKIVDTLRPVIGLRYGDKLLHVGDASDTAVIHKNGIEETVNNPVVSYFDATRRRLSGRLTASAGHQIPIVAVFAFTSLVAALVAIYRRPSTGDFVEV